MSKRNSSRNFREQADGAEIYRKRVRPAVVDLRKVAAHYAVASVLEPSAELRRVYCYEVQREDFSAREQEKMKLAIGRVRICSTITAECALLTFAALHHGDHQIRVGVRESRDDSAYAAIVNELSEALLGTKAAEIVLRLDEMFGNGPDSLQSLFKDEQRKILELTLAPLVAEAEAAHSQNAALMRSLTNLQIPLPKTFRSSAEFALNQHLRAEFSGEEPNLQRIAPLIEEAKAINVRLDLSTLEHALRTRLEQMAEQLSASPIDPRLLPRFRAAVELARALPFPVNLWHVQNLFHEQLRFLSRKSCAGIQQAPEALAASDLAALGETLLFTPQAVDILFHSARAE